MKLPTLRSMFAWFFPLLLLLLTCPLWLHWWEPAQFLTLNGWCALIPAPWWTALSLMGNGWGVLALTAPLLLLAPRFMWAWLCAAPFAALFARLGKALIVSPRPAAEIDPTQFHVVGEILSNVSMPSGHTTTAFAVASALFFALPEQRRWRSPAPLLLLLALAVGLSRVAVGAHWPGDVAVGLSLGLWAGLLGNLLLLRVPPSWSQPKHWALRCVALLVAIAVFVLLTDPLDFAENTLAQQLLAAIATLSLLGFLRRSV